jgi:acetoin utilization deacetylase AcuC-like enzyme
MQTAYITHPQCQLHDMGHYHPECPERLRAIEDQLIASGLLGFLSRYEAPPALREHLDSRP